MFFYIFLDSRKVSQLSSNSIGFSGFRRLMRKFGLAMTEEQFRSLFKKFDVTGSCLNEFLCDFCLAVKQLGEGRMYF